MLTNTTRRPWNPYWVLIAGALLPGSGHVMLGLPTRGLLFVSFIILLGWVSVNLMPTYSSFFGRHIGGIFVYGLSVIDAYKYARVKWEQWKFVVVSTLAERSVLKGPSSRPPSLVGRPGGG